MRIVVLLLFLHIVECSTFDETKFNSTWSSLTRRASSAFRSAIKSNLPSMLRVISRANISSSCGNGLMSYMIALQRSESWSVEMLDATAKFPSGILRGTSMDFGEFDECLRIKVLEARRNSTDKEKFRGRYCTISCYSDLFLSAWRRHSEPNYTDTYGEPPEWMQSLVKKLGDFSKHVQFIFGICIPSLCSQIDLQRLSSAFLNPLGMKVSVTDCQVDEPYVWPTHTVVAIVALVILALICIIGTALDVIERKRKTDCYEKNDFDIPNENESAVLEFLKAFSVVTNSGKIMHPAKENALSVFHGIRFLSATWIIFGHTYLYTDEWRMYSRRNMLHFMDLSNDVSTAVIDNFTLAVDTFFFMSGFLLVYVTWRQMKKNKGKLNVLKFFISKYIRMTPAVCLAMALLMIMPAIDSGPLWPSTLNPRVANCEATWWANFLYVGNFIDPKIMCLDHMWYIAALMQFHIVGVVILMLFYRSRALGSILGLVLTGISAAVIIFQVLSGNYNMPSIANMKDLDLMYDFGEFVYLKPHFHFTCYLIGMIVAYFVVKYKEKKLSSMHQILGWCCAVGAALFSVYGIFINNNSKAFQTFYIVAYRPTWAISVGWLVYMCCSGYGGIVNRLLSHRMMYPFSQLSYMIYVIHPLILVYKGASQRERLYFSQSEQVFFFFSIIFSSILSAFVGSITVEIPFQNIYKIIFKNKTIVKKIENVEKVENKIIEENIITMNNINIP